MLNIVSKKLNIIKKDEGNIYPILKSCSDHFKGFGEVYISSINSNVSRAWKKHKNSHQYFVVPIGEVKFVFLIEEEENHHFKEIIIGETNYSFIKIPNNIWYGFKNISKNTSFIVNVIDKPYNLSEAESIEIDKFPFKGYNW